MPQASCSNAGLYRVASAVLVCAAAPARAPAASTVCAAAPARAPAASTVCAVFSMFLSIFVFSIVFTFMIKRDIFQFQRFAHVIGNIARVLRTFSAHLRHLFSRRCERIEETLYYFCRRISPRPQNLRNCNNCVRAARCVQLCADAHTTNLRIRTRKQT